ncbi:MAG: hypothetical protein WCC93_01000, partial [Chthoniobacterales bacterium]
LVIYRLIMKTLNQARVQQPSEHRLSSLCAKQSCSLFPISELKARRAHRHHADVAFAPIAKSLNH